MNSDTTNVLLIFFAALSALFACLCFLLLFLDFRRRQPQLKITFETQNDPEQDMPEIFICSAKNIGHGELKLETFFFHTKDKYAVIYPPDAAVFVAPPPKLPLTLQEGEAIKIGYFLPQLLSDFKKESVIPQYFGFTDIKDRRYKKRIGEKHAPFFFEQKSKKWLKFKKNTKSVKTDTIMAS